MKKIFLLLMIASFATTCKKKKADPVTPTPTPVVYTISLKVDGVLKQCSSACYSGSNSSGLRGSYFYLSGIDEEIYFGCGTLPAKGSQNLVKYGNPNLVYYKNNAPFHAASGTINITSIDTSAGGVIVGLVGTFSFKTDTSSTGTSFNMTEGTINLKN